MLESLICLGCSQEWGAELGLYVAGPSCVCGLISVSLCAGTVEAESLCEV